MYPIYSISFDPDKHCLYNHPRLLPRMSTSSTPPSTSVDEKSPHIEHAERIAIHDRVPGHENYYERNGLRAYGGGEDHDHEPPVRNDLAPSSCSNAIIALLPPLDSLIAMAFLFTGSQIPVYLLGTSTLRSNSNLADHRRCYSSVHIRRSWWSRSVGSSSSLLLATSTNLNWIWFVLANLLALAGVCPFVGSLSDL